MYEDRAERRGRALLGLRLASASIDPNDPETAAVRVGEALFWMTVVDDLSDPQERHRLAPALRMVRNAVAHGAAPTVVRRTGKTSPHVWPARWHGIDWAPTELILAVLTKPPRAATVAQYASEVAGREVQPVIADMLAWYE